MNGAINRTVIFTLAFWGLLAAFVAFDWLHATPHDRFAEPAPWALGQPPIDDGSAHCSAPLKR